MCCVADASSVLGKVFKKWQVGHLYTFLDPFLSELLYHMSAASAYAIHTCVNCLLIKTRYHAGIALQFQYEIRKRGLHDS